MKWRLVYTRSARQDARKIVSAGLKSQVEVLLKILGNDPYSSSPPYEKLRGDLTGAISRRINIKHRLVYQVLEDEGVVKVIRMWSHYE
ncbi:MAG: Txe/YoeB family addiction module toxin [Candidatus Marinimicrobia bacterium]|nr:Txe/YoeB family addiction module toxin [Candidatus Neomarinimicrobiota bacterium]